MWKDVFSQCRVSKKPYVVPHLEMTIHHLISSACFSLTCSRTRFRVGWGLPCHLLSTSSPEDVCGIGIGLGQLLIIYERLDEVSDRLL